MNTQPHTHTPGTIKAWRFTYRSVYWDLLTVEIEGETFEDAEDEFWSAYGKEVEEFIDSDMV